MQNGWKNNQLWRSGIERVPAKYRATGLSFIFLLCLVATGPKNEADSSTDTRSSDALRKADSVLALMTLQEKAGQLNQLTGSWDITGPVPEDANNQKKYNDIKQGYVGSMLNVTSVKHIRAAQKLAVENSRLKIPMIFALDVLHGYQTMMPIPLAESCSWNLELIKKSAAVAAAEAAAAGLNWTFAPMVDIGRDARWGRVMEGAGEDPYLGALIAKARVEGFQGNLNDESTIAACVKHFAGYGFVEAGREYNTVEIGENTLRNIVLPPFKTAVEAGVATFMNGFHEISGTPVTGNDYLQRDILKGEWGFEGMVVSDWGSIYELLVHGVAKDSMEAAEIAIKAGSDMDMEGKCYVNFLADLVTSGRVEEAILDDAVRRVLRLKFELGLFDDPYKYCNAEREKSVLGAREHLDVATQVARESIVLLKNENNMLPIDQNKSILVVGPLAADSDSPLGSWRGKAIPNSAVTVLEGIESVTGKKVQYEKGCRLIDGPRSFAFKVEVNTHDKTGFDEAIRAARSRDMVIMVLGEDCYLSGEGRSRTQIGIPGVQLDLLKAVYEVNRNIVLVLMNGRPLTLEWESENIPAIVEAWHLGSGSGPAIAEVLFGKYNPSGKLTMSFPRNVGQCPVYYNSKGTGRPTTQPHDAGMVFYSHFIDSERDALYPFGHGLSYSTFDYSDVTLSATQIKTDGTVTVSTTVTNTSKVDGEEVVQLYIRDLASKKTRPVKELKGFKKIRLKAGERADVSFELQEKELGYYCNGQFVVEPGEFEVFVGGSSAQLKKSRFTVHE